ncbi:hypothetical protein Phab24_id116 [Acinetobacter phage Phab24]|nr:hypothetical protein Phab24_id116 [Acinetobacter phage Phab24]
MKIRYIINQYNDSGEWLDDHGVFDNVEEAIEKHQSLVSFDERINIFTIEVHYFKDKDNG